jgi:hypothetical protein
MKKDFGKNPHIGGFSENKRRDTYDENIRALNFCLTISWISVFCCSKDFCSDSVSILGFDEVSCFRFCKKVETVAEYGEPLWFKVAMFAPLVLRLGCFV